MRLNVLSAGEGPPVVLLHGLTASHRYVVMGSRYLERAGHRVVTYDARGHGASAPAPEPTAYSYDDLADDLVTVLDQQEIPRAVLVGASMGAHTALTLTLRQPERVAGLGLVTPAFLPGKEVDPAALADWDRLADGMQAGGAEGFTAAYDFEAVPEQWRDTVRRVVSQRLAVHEHPQAVADALRGVPRSAPFSAFQDLAEIQVPTTVVGDRDEADPGHPLAVAERYAELISDATLIVEEPGKSPIAWQGGQLSRAIEQLVARTDLASKA